MKTDFLDFLQIQAIFRKTNYITFSYLLIATGGQTVSKTKNFGCGREILILLDIYRHLLLKKEFRIEELNTWNVEKPLKYLKNQGVVITSDTRKRDLVSKVYHACRLDLPLCSTKNKTMPKSKRDERKSSLSMVSRFLYWKNWKTG